MWFYSHCFHLSVFTNLILCTHQGWALSGILCVKILPRWMTKKRNWINNILALLVSPFNFFYTILNPFQPSSEIKLNFIYIASIFHKLTLLLNTDKAPYLRHREPVWKRCSLTAKRVPAGLVSMLIDSLSPGCFDGGCQRGVDLLQAFRNRRMGGASPYTLTYSHIGYANFWTCFAWADLSRAFSYE